MTSGLLKRQRIQEILEDWDRNYYDMDIHKVLAELTELFGELAAEDQQKEMAAFSYLEPRCCEEAEP